MGCLLGLWVGKWHLSRATWGVRKLGDLFFFFPVGWLAQCMGVSLETEILVLSYTVHESWCDIHSFALCVFELTSNKQFEHRSWSTCHLLESISKLAPAPHRWSVNLWMLSPTRRAVHLFFWYGTHVIPMNQPVKSHFPLLFWLIKWMMVMMGANSSTCTHKGESRWRITTRCVCRRPFLNQYLESIGLWHSRGCICS